MQDYRDWKFGTAKWTEAAKKIQNMINVNYVFLNFKLDARPYREYVESSSDDEEEKVRWLEYL